MHVESSSGLLIQERHGAPGMGAVKGDEGDLGTGASLIRKC